MCINCTALHTLRPNKITRFHFSTVFSLLHMRGACVIIFHLFLLYFRRSNRSIFSIGGYKLSFAHDTVNTSDSPNWIWLKCISTARFSCSFPSSIVCAHFTCVSLFEWLCPFLFIRFLLFFFCLFSFCCILPYISCDAVVMMHCEHEWVLKLWIFITIESVYRTICTDGRLSAHNCISYCLCAIQCR